MTSMFALTQKSFLAARVNAFELQIQKLRFVPQSASLPSKGSISMSEQVSSLNQKQIDCLLLVGLGYSSKQIAPLVRLSHRSVDTYVTSALRALDVNDRSKAAQIVSEASLLASEDLLQQLQSEPDHVANQQDSAFSVLSSTAAKLLQVPPIGGQENDLTTKERLTAILQVGLLTGVVVTALVAGVSWVMALIP